MIYRKEEEKDYDTVYEVIKEAFASAEHSDGTEQDLVVKLRKSDAFIPELSLVAEDEGKITGHIMYTKIELGSAQALAMAPLSILPKYQRRGVGKALMKEGHRIARELGYEFSVVLGSEKYYPREGYTPASGFGIKAPFKVPDENFMALDLQGSSKNPDSTVVYAKEFFEA